jgi:L-fuconolactonase
MNPIPIVDSHVHFWNPRRLRYPWLASQPALNRTFEPPDFFAQALPVEVEKVVFVEAGRATTQNILEVGWVEDLASREPRIRGVVAHATIERGVAVRPELEALSKHRLVKGVRRLLQDESDPGFCLESVFIQGVKSLAKYHFSFDICIYHYQLVDVIELVRRCPEITFVLDHLGKPGVRDRLLAPWQAQIKQLAAFPNVWCKLSGLVTEADPQHWLPEDLRPYIQHILDCFGYKRVMFGSDWPVATLATTYSRWVDTVRNALSGASDLDQRAVFHTNANTCYRL